MIKLLRVIPDLEKEISQGNLAALKEHLTRSIAYMQDNLMYAKKGETELYQGALRILHEVKELLP